MAVIAALSLCVCGALLLAVGARSESALPAPLPSKTFSVDPAVLPPLALPPLDGVHPPVIDQQNTDGSSTCAFTAEAAHVVISSLCVDAPIVTSTITAQGDLVIPENVHQVGMWNQGASLRGPTGQAVTAGTTLLASHVNDYAQGNGAFYNLHRAEPGSVIYVSDPAGRLTRWRVTSLDVVIKSALPARLFVGATGPRTLALVTCGGPIEHLPGHGNIYRDNVIVTATPA